MIVNTRAVLTAALVGCLFVTACGSGSTGRTTDAGSATTTTLSTAKVLDAAAVVAALKQAGLPIGDVTVYTETTDPNHLLGRPGGYTSKAGFVDKRVKESEAKDTSKGAVDLGGGVEVFAATADAVTRGKYLATMRQAVQMFGTEYDYTAGGVLLRLSSVLTPTQAQGYVAALGKATSVTPVAVTK